MIGARIPKRIGGFDLLKVPSLEIWLSALDFSLANNAAIAAWQDRKFGKTLSVNDVLQPGKRFRYITNVLNGQGIVRTFDSAIGFGPVSCVLSVADSAPLRVTEFAAITVARVFGNVVNSGTGPIGVVDDSGGLRDGWIHHGYGGGGLAGTPRGYAYEGSVARQVNYLGDQNQLWRVRSTVRSATSFRAYVNGVLVGDQVPLLAIGMPAANTVLNIGCGVGQNDGAAFTSSFEGMPPTMDYAEIALFAGALADGQRKQVEKVLGARWGIAVA